MADYYSEHYTTTSGGTSVDDPRIKAPPGISHAKLHYKKGIVVTAAGVTDDEQCRFFPMKSGDRLIQLFLTATAMTGTSMDCDCGLYTPDGGAVLDLDLFGAAATAPLDDLSVAVVRTDLFILGAADDEDRGKPLWETLFEGAGTDTEDPFLTYDVVITMNTETAITVGNTLILEAFYTSAGN